MAPFKFKFSRMSKSNSSTRSNSMETPAECESELNSPQQDNVPAILEGAEPDTPSSPPPSYEFVLEEVSKINLLRTFKYISNTQQKLEWWRSTCICVVFSYLGFSVFTEAYVLIKAFISRRCSYR